MNGKLLHSDYKTPIALVVISKTLLPIAGSKQFPDGPIACGGLVLAKTELLCAAGISHMLGVVAMLYSKQPSLFAADSICFYNPIDRVSGFTR